MNYSFTTYGQIFVVTVSGRLTMAEVLAFWDDMDRQPEYAKAKGMLLSLRLVWWEMTRENIEELAMMGGRLRLGRWAFVTAEDLSFGMVQTFASLAKGGAVLQVFKDEAAARQWLAQ